MAKKVVTAKRPKRAVGQTTAPRKVKAGVRPQARSRTLLDKAIDEAGTPFARRSVEAFQRPSWARFEAFAADDGSEAEIDLYDVIGTWDLNAATFRRQLAGIKADRLTVNINSPGGSVFDGFAMYQDLRDYPGHVHVRVRGIAASIASLIAMAGDTIEMADNAFLMIHNSWAGVLGDKGELAKAARLLGQIDTRLAATYAASAEQRADKPGSAAAFAEMMDAETWLDAEQARKLGLADSVGEAVPKAHFAGLDVSHFAKTPTAIKAASKAQPKATPEAATVTAPALDLAPLSAALARCIETLSK